MNIGLNNYYLFQSYLKLYNLNNDTDLIIKYHHGIYKQYILKYKLNIEYKEYLKSKQNSILHIKKLQNVNDKNNLIKVKNLKRLNHFSEFS